MDDRIEIMVSSAAVAGLAIGGRATQQDNLACLHDPDGQAHLLVLADGMGGHGAGEIASRLVIDMATRLWDDGQWKDQPGALFLEALCQQAHLALRQRRETLGGAEPHSTVVCLLVKGELAYWAHVGDSRLYRFQGRRFLGCTEDHSVTQEKVRRGELDAAASGRDAQQHMLLQGLGGDRAPVVEHGCMPLHEDHIFVLCSDGVWGHLSTNELQVFALRRENAQALRDAMTLVLQRGGNQGDNAALIFARPGRAHSARRRGLRQWLPLAGRGR